VLPVPLLRREQAALHAARPRHGLFSGGFGTLDELFDVLTLIQTGKAKPMPVLLFDEKYWRRIVSFDAMVDEGVISPEDRDLVRYVETAEAAWRAICAHYDIDPALADDGPSIAGE
jgi:predicted Rossmann-fold nucleotide-binding protein